MNFLQETFTQLEAAPDTTILQELRDGEIFSVTASELLELVRKARSFLAAQHLNKGDRCALLANNAIRWVAMDLAIMAEGLIVVPLYARQAPPELVAMMKDCAPALICCGDAELRDGIGKTGVRLHLSLFSIRFLIDLEALPQQWSWLILMLSPSFTPRVRPAKRKA